MGGGDAPTLIQPGPLDFEDRYPIPVSTFQDQQQEEFWAVGVRNFGHSLLYRKALTQGVRVNYNVTRDAANVYHRTTAGAQRIRGQLPGWNEMSKAEDKMLTLRFSMNLNRE